MPNVDRCSKCNRAISWTVNPATGAKIPLDARPMVAYMIEMRDGEAMAIKVAATITGDRPFYVSHFQTCPNVADFAR